MPSEGLVIVENVSTINYLTTHKEMSVYNHEMAAENEGGSSPDTFYQLTKPHRANNEL